MHLFILAAAALFPVNHFIAMDPYQVAIHRLGTLESPPTLTRELKERIAASLPKEGDVRYLTPIQREKLAAILPVLRAHQRENEYLIKVVESPQARLGLYARSVLLITDTALRLLSTSEIQALVGHEIGHEYIWDEFEEARKRGDYVLLKQLELVCDGVAIQTLLQIGVPVPALLNGLKVMIESDRAQGFEVESRTHPTLKERAKFAQRFAR